MSALQSQGVRSTAPLPTEILHEIFSHFIPSPPPRSEGWDNDSICEPPVEDINIRTLHALTTVSRQFYSVSRPLLYRHVVISWDRHIRTLFRTVVRSPYLAALVRSVTIIEPLDWDGLYPPPKGLSSRVLPREASTLWRRVQTRKPGRVWHWNNQVENRDVCLCLVALLRRLERLQEFRYHVYGGKYEATAHWVCTTIVNSLPDRSKLNKNNSPEERLFAALETLEISGLKSLGWATFVMKKCLLLPNLKKLLLLPPGKLQNRHLRTGLGELSHSLKDLRISMPFPPQYLAGVLSRIAALEVLHYTLPTKKIRELETDRQALKRAASVQKNTLRELRVQFDYQVLRGLRQWYQPSQGPFVWSFVSYPRLQTLEIEDVLLGYSTVLGTTAPVLVRLLPASIQELSLRVYARGTRLHDGTDMEQLSRPGTLSTFPDLRIVSLQDGEVISMHDARQLVLAEAEFVRGGVRFLYNGGPVEFTVHQAMGMSAAPVWLQGGSG